MPRLAGHRITDVAKDNGRNVSRRGATLTATMTDAPSERLSVIRVDELGRMNADELAAEAVDWVTVVRMIGGSVTFGADRQEIAPGEFVTMAVIFRWKSFLAPARRLKPRHEHLPDPEPEPVAADGDGS